MGFLAYLPLIGAGLVWILAAGYLTWQGAYGKAFILIGFGLVNVVMDYLILNILVGGRSRLHTLLVFLFGVGRSSALWVIAVGITVTDMWRMDTALPDVSSSTI